MHWFGSGELHSPKDNPCAVEYRGTRYVEKQNQLLSIPTPPKTPLPAK